MHKLPKSIEKKVGAIRLVAKTARTAGTAIYCEIEVWNGKLLFSDDKINLGRDAHRRAFAKRVAERVAEAEVAQVEDALLELKTAVEGHVKKGMTTVADRYEARADGLYWLKPTGEGHEPTRLTNFTARIVSEIVEDDGASETHFVKIESVYSGESKSFTIPVEKFNSMTWAMEQISAGARIEAGFGLKDHARAAIQTLSKNIELRKIFAHLGWRLHGEDWVYVHAGGALGAGGQVEDVSVDLTRRDLTDYVLPEPSKDDPERLIAAVQASLATLELAAGAVAYPLLAAVYRAPLSAASATDLAVFVEGSSGTFKSSVTGVFQAHYGRSFRYDKLPAGWESSDNALELQAFAAKDAVFTIDDFKPKGTKWDVEALHKKADRVLRGQANQQGRGRMTADAMLKPDYYPRGLIVSSGEDIPKGQSLRARTLILEVTKGDVDPDRLTHAQKAAAEGLLAEALAGYVRYLAPRMGALKAELEERHAKLRTKAMKAGVTNHPRTPGNIASLALGLETYLDYARSIGAISEADKERIWDEGWSSLVSLGRAQAFEQENQDEAERFLDLIRSGLTSGAAHLADRSGGQPKNASRWGWRTNGFGDVIPRGELIGWLEGEDVYLDGPSACRLARRLAEREGSQFTTGRDALYKRLKQAGFLAGSDEGRSTVKRAITGKQLHVLFFKASTLGMESGPSGPGGPSSDLPPNPLFH